MRRRLAELALLALCSASVLSGCRLGRATWRATGAYFATPKPVKTTHTPVTKDARLAVIWIGHASALIQIDDKVILTDPVFTSTVGQMSRRLVDPGLDPKDLPPVDVVLVSHMHYDHLSLGSLGMIEKRVRSLLLPPGGKAYITDGFSFPSSELRKWQSWENQGLKVTAVPVDHVGFRYGIDDDWMTYAFTGYVIEYHGIKVYFGGDSAYNQTNFVETAQRFPKLDLALIPIAPIEPREFMRRTHMDPHEAVQAFLDLDAKRMVPIHYGTFVDSTDNPGDALRELAKANAHFGLGGYHQITPLAIGERRVFLKAGEGPAAQDAPPTPQAPVPAPTPAPSSSSTIPDDDKFD